MVMVLYVIGVLVTAIGFVAIGFGIPINAFSFGETLIVAGTTAAVGGLLLIGLGAGVAELKRIAEGARSRPARPAEAVEAALAPPQASRIPPRAPAPPRPMEAAMPRPPEPPPMAEPRFPISEDTEVATGPLDWLRPKAKGSNGQAPMVDVPDEAPLSPRTPPRPAMSPLATMAEPGLEPKAWSPNRNESAEPKPDPRSEARPLPRSERIARVTAERPRENGMFDTVWPEAKAPQPAHEPAEPKVEAAPPPHEEAAAEPPASERPVAILKSGVIDGMAYTLYADGSIEAELPQGTVRFASVDALRAHLEKSG
jgi:hypothetical protein